MPENTNPENDLFEAALLRSPGPERTAFLDGECRSDPELRARVEMMLEGHLNAKDFLDTLPDGVAPERKLASPETAGLEPRGSHIGPYKLLQKLGEGGCGLVYLAEQNQPVRRRVALKVIKLGMDTRSVIARFEAERQALALMDHPNIAKVFDAGTTETGRPYFVMELVRGIRISEYCDKNNLPTEQRLSLFIQVCQAIQHAHQKGIIHRDIKPSNILITLHDGVPVPKVIDFGIAKATSDQRLTDKTIFTAFEQFIGTPAYMSPEQAEMSGLDIDTRSDIYSLGVLLYELLTGSPPFDSKELLASGLDAMRKTIREKEPLRPSTKFATLEGDELATTAQRRSAEPSRLLHQLQGDLDWIIMKCLEKDRSRRYETANGLVADLRRHLSDEPVVARPPSTAYRLQKAFLRNKLVFAAGSSVALALIAGIGVSTWQAIEATNARNRATRAEAAKTQEARIAEQDRDRAVRAENDAQAQAVAAKAAWAATRRAAYAAEINVAFQSLKENSLDHARELLDRQRPKIGEEDLRGFEWRYLWQLCRGDEIASFPDGGRHAVAFSPDGKLFASTYGKTIVRETASQKIICTLSGASTTLSFAPHTNLLATAGESGVTLWDTVTWERVRSLTNAIDSALFSPDGRWLVTGATEGYQVWNTETWEALKGAFPDPGPYRWHLRNSVAFSRDSHFVIFTAAGATGRPDHFQVWRLPKLEMLFPLRPNSPAVAVAFSADGKHIVAGSKNGEITAWDFATRQVLATRKEHTAWITGIVTAPDGKTFATTSADRTVLLWDAATFELLVRLRGHVGEVWGLAISPDSSGLVTTSDDGTTKMWNPNTRHTDLVLDGLLAGFVDGGRQLVTVTSKGWSVSTSLGAAVSFPISANPPLLFKSARLKWPIRPADVMPTEATGALGRPDGTVELQNLASGIRTTAWKAHDSGISVVSFSSNGKRLATASPTPSREVKLWDGAPPRETVRIGPVECDINCLAFSPDGKILAGSGVSPSGRVLLWDTTTGREALELESSSSWDAVMTVAFSPDGKMLAAASLAKEEVRLWELPSGKQLSGLKGHLEGPCQVAFSPDGKTLASSSNDGKVKLWNVATRQELLTFFRDSPFPTALRFSPDGVTLALSDSSTAVGQTRFLHAPSFEEIEALETKEKAESTQP